MQAVEVKGKNAHKTRQLRGCGNQTVKRRKARGIHDEWRVRVVFTICMRAPFETQSLIVFSRQQIARANLGLNQTFLDHVCIGRLQLGPAYRGEPGRRPDHHGNKRFTSSDIHRRHIAHSLGCGTIQILNFTVGGTWKLPPSFPGSARLATAMPNFRSRLQSAAATDEETTLARMPWP
jgi:hypothetical protein